MTKCVTIEITFALNDKTEKTMSKIEEEIWQKEWEFGDIVNTNIQNVFETDFTPIVL